MIVVLLLACSHPAPEVSTAVAPAVAGLLADIDTDADPCVDFYAFACGGWHENHPGEWRRETDRSVAAPKLLLGLLDEAAAGAAPPDPAAADAWGFLGSWRRSCDDLAQPHDAVDRAIDEAGTAPVAAAGALAAYGIDTVVSAAFVEDADGERVLLGRPSPVLLDRRLDPAIWQAWDGMKREALPGTLVPIADRTGGFDWAAYASAAGFDGLTVVVDATWADELEATFAATPPEVLLGVVREVGKRSVQAPWSKDACIASIVGEGAPLLAPHYLARVLTDADRLAGIALGEEIRSVLLEDLDRSKIMPEEATALGVQALTALAIDIGPPAAVAFHPEPLGPSFGGHQLAAAREIRLATIAVVRDGKGTSFLMPPWMTNAAYTPSEHRVFVTAAGISRPWMVDGSRLMSTGGLGAVLGHEMIHALTIGDPDSRHQEWITTVGLPFERYGGCLKREHEGWRRHLATEGLPPYMASAEEDVADAMGLHAAWQSWDDGPRDPYADRFDPLTGDQVFFAAYGQAMCDALLYSDGRHDVMRVRLNAAVAQEPAFAEAFGCFPGTPEAPKRRCEPLF